MLCVDVSTSSHNWMWWWQLLRGLISLIVSSYSALLAHCKIGVLLKELVDLNLCVFFAWRLAMILCLSFQNISMFVKLGKLFFFVFECFVGKGGIHIFDLFSQKLNEFFIYCCQVSLWIFGVSLLKLSTLLRVSNFWHFHISLLFLWRGKGDLRNVIWLLSFLITYGLMKGLRQRTKQLFSWK